MAKINVSKVKNISSLKELTIDLSEWGMHLLFNKKDNGKFGEKGTKCCLGHVLCALGVPEDELADAAMPSNLLNGMENQDAAKKLAKKLGWLLGDERFNTFHDSRFAEDAARYNDNCTYRQGPAVQKLIKALFKEKGIKLKFKGKAPKGREL